MSKKNRIKIKTKTVKNKIPEMVKALEAINGKKIEVGAFDGEAAWLAGIHEYGMTIHAKEKKYLTVPLCPEAAGKEVRARNFKNTWVYTSKKGEKFIVQNKGKDIKFLYWLTESVVIPERSFLRAGFDTYIDNVNKQIDLSLRPLLNGHITPEKFLEIAGNAMVSKIKLYMRDLDNPKNSDITIENKGEDNPLHKTGHLRSQIRYKITD